MGQILRAVERNGPVTVDELEQLVGASYWERDRFERALAFAVADGLVVRNGDGQLQAAP
jgi:hypothetical protein